MYFYTPILSLLMNARFHVRSITIEIETISTVPRSSRMPLSNRTPQPQLQAALIYFLSLWFLLLSRMAHK